MAHERETKALREQVTAVAKQRDGALREVNPPPKTPSHPNHPTPNSPPKFQSPWLQAEEARAQLRLVTEARAAGRRELLEAQREARESREGREAQRRQAQEARRALGDEAREKEALRRSNEELRAALRRAEGERIR